MDRSIGAYEAKTKLSALPERVERGESLTIPRNGTAVARLVPPLAQAPLAPPAAVAEAFRAMREKLRRDGRKPFTIEEIVEFRDAGRRG